MSIMSSGFDKQFLAYCGNTDLWKFERLQSSKKHRIRKKNYRLYLNGLMKEDFGADVRGLNFPQLMRFASICNTRFGNTDSYSKKPSENQLSEALYDACVTKITW